MKLTSRTAAVDVAANAVPTPNASNQRSPARLVAGLIALIAINRYGPAIPIGTAKIELPAAKRQDNFLLIAVSQILRVDCECLPVQPRAFGGRDVTRIVTGGLRRAFAIEPIKSDRCVVTCP